MNIAQYPPLTADEKKALATKARASIAENRYTSEVLPQGAIAVFNKAVSPALVLRLLGEIDEQQSIINALKLVNAAHLNKAQEAIKTLMNFPEYEEAAQLLENTNTKIKGHE